MLSKFLKYESRALWRTLMPLMIAAVSCGTAAGLINRWMLAVSVERPVFSLTLFSVYSIAMAAVYVLCIIGIGLILYRYYRSVFTDEGYLTMVIPTEPSGIFSCKLLAGGLWALIVLAVLGVSLFLASLPMIISALIHGGVPAIDTFLPDLTESGVNEVLYIVDRAVNAVMTWILLYTAVNLGSVCFRRQKLFGALLFILLLWLAKTVIESLVSAFIPAGVAGNIYYIGEILFAAAVGVGLYFLSVRLLSTRFNIE